MLAKLLKKKHRFNYIKCLFIDPRSKKIKKGANNLRNVIMTNYRGFNDAV